MKKNSLIVVAMIGIFLGNFPFLEFLPGTKCTEPIGVLLFMGIAGLIAIGGKSA